MSETRQNLLLGFALLLVVGAAFFGYQVLGKLERIVSTAERTEAKLDRIIEATAPLGRAAVEKGTLVLENINDQEMADSASRGLKDLGNAAKRKLTEMIQNVDADSDGVNVEIELKDK